MHNSKRITGIVLFFIVSIVFFSIPASGKIVNEVSKEPTVSLELNDSTLVEVSKEITKQTGYKVILHEKLKLVSVSGSYEKITVVGFFRRVLRKHNVSCLFDEKEKFFYIGFYGDKIPSKAALAMTGSQEAQGKEPDQYKQQMAELKEYLANPESVDPMSGMKLTEIRKMHDVQGNEIRELRKKAQSGDGKSLYNAQLTELEELKKNPDTIDPTSGMKLGEIKVLAEDQLATLKKQRDDSSQVVDKESGMTLAELQKMHEYQREEYYEIFPWASGRR